MQSYAAFLGHQPHISLAELCAAIPGFALQKLFASSAAPMGSRNVVLFNSTADLTNAQLGMLGGTVVIAKQVTDVRVTEEDVPELLWNELGDVKGKLIFSLRVHGLPPTKVRGLYRACKEELRRHGRHVRYVGSERVPAASVLLKDAGLLDGKHGCELSIVAYDEHLWVGRTVAAQDVDAYAKRDVHKPVRDTMTGLLPPKLAQVLLNLGDWLYMQSHPSDKKRPLTVLDPFCGTGVIPMECLLRGWTALASDTSLKAVNGCTKNLEWIRKEENILKRDVPSLVWKQDATKPFKLKNPPDLIVTETTLGTPFTKRPTIRDAQSERAANEKLQETFLRNVAATLPGTPLVCTWPVWHTSKGPVKLERLRAQLAGIGFDMVSPPASNTTLLYRRPDQYVGREIVLLSPRTKAQ